ncbi:hypothetical protein F5Y11DRAFT_350109 [Daldinia sp. FL1419]|nr:hypothetical protein F5Y11DRAFT_350109 [Daldinia sp. FL1419]
MARSRIPTFILDTDHQWISENRDWLESYPDVANALCDKSSPLWTDPSPGREIPADLFGLINIDNNKASVSRLGWDNAVARLTELRNCSAVLEDVKYLHVYIYVHDGQYSDPLSESELPPKLPGLFADVLASMPHLERLDWGIGKEYSGVFGEEFTRRNLTLPSVRHLVPSPQSHYLLSICPNLEILEAGSFFHHGDWNSPRYKGRDSWLELVRAASTVSTLKELSLANRWSLDSLEEVLKAMPNLTKLTLQGSLGPERWIDTDVNDGTHEGKLLKEYLSVISKFPKLEQLHLPDSSDLNLGFDGGAWCGNAYDGEDGRKYGRSVVKENIDTTELAGDIVLKAVPHLQILSIGGNRANFTRNENGDFEIVWPWTERKEEYAYEIFPE